MESSRNQALDAVDLNPDWTEEDRDIVRSIAAKCDLWREWKPQGSNRWGTLYRNGGAVAHPNLHKIDFPNRNSETILLSTHHTRRGK